MKKTLYNIDMLDRIDVYKMRFIGCKTLLLEKIEEIIDENIHNAKSFCDIFRIYQQLQDILKVNMKYILMIYYISLQIIF